MVQRLLLGASARHVTRSCMDVIGDLSTRRSEKNPRLTDAKLIRERMRPTCQLQTRTAKNPIEIHGGLQKSDSLSVLQLTPILRGTQQNNRHKDSWRLMSVRVSRIASFCLTGA